MDLFAGQPGAVLEGLAYILLIQVGILRHNLCGAQA